MKMILVLPVCLLLVSLAFPRPACGAAPSTRPAAAPATQPAQPTPEGCVIEKFDVPSPSMKREIHALVVLPPGYGDNPNKRYPILYTLHGMGAPYATYSDMAPLRKALKDRPMIVASFDCDRAGWYIDSSRKPANQFETFFFAEFIPYLDSHYRTNGQRAVTGFSMGGFGALHYMLAKPEMFSSVSAHSGAFFRFQDANHKAGVNFFQELLGPQSENREAYEKLDVSGGIEKAVRGGVRLPPMLIHCGTEDGLLPNNQELCRLLIAQNKLIAAGLAKDPSVAAEKDPKAKAKALDQLFLTKRLDFLYVESPGGHNWIFWRGASEMMIDFHWRSFRDAPKPAGAPGSR